MWLAKPVFVHLSDRVRLAEDARMELDRQIARLASVNDVQSKHLLDAQRDRDYWKGRSEALESAVNSARGSEGRLADDLATLTAENRELRAALVDAKAAHQVTVAHFEWLQVMFNRESTERSIISQQRLGVTLPPVTVGRPNDGPVKEGPTYEASQNFSEPLPGQEPAPAVVGQPTPEGEHVDDIARLEAEVGTLLFQDAGDEGARKIGATHDDSGAVVYSR